MKRLFIIFAIFIVGSFSVYGQTYTPMSYDDYSAPLRDYQRAFNRAANQIQSIESTIMGALANDIDEELRSQLNYDYKRLNSISQKLNRNGLYADVWTEISNVRSSVNSHINQYNNRVAAERRRQAQELERQRQAELERQKELERQAEEQKKAGWSGTGFALNQGHIVTNYHVVENAQTILVKGVKGDFNIELRAKVVATDKVNDIAIIKIDDTRFNGFGAIPYKIKRGMADVGESVWALGYPMIGMMGEEIKFTDGKISAKTGLQGDISTYQVSVPLQPGNSGGPLFDNNGYIVGINSSGLNKLYSEQTIQAENVNYSIKTSYLYNLIESSMSASILPQGTAMQGQSLTEKIKLAKKFVYIILCSEDQNFHKEMLPVHNNEEKSTTTKVTPPSNVSSSSPTPKSVNGTKDKSATKEDEIMEVAPITKKSMPSIELDKYSHDFGSFLECNGPVETTFRITNTGECQLWLEEVSTSSKGVKIALSDRLINARKSGTINVTYDPKLRPGEFTETITIKGFALDSVVKINIKGEVIGRKIVLINANGDSIVSSGGSMYSKDIDRLAISKITLTPDSTILDCSYASGMLSIDKKTYLKTNNGRKYKLQSVKNIPYNPDFREIPSGQHESFSLYFNRLPESTGKFDLIEDAKPGWKIYGIQLK